MEWAIVFATLLGPILAVQAQKWVERATERRRRKENGFRTLMGTRGARVSREHVQALNLIEIVFHGRSRSEQTVLATWKEYLDQLNTRYSDNEFPIWITKSDDLFVNMLHAMSIDLEFTFDRVQLKRGGYSPIAHGNLENEQAQIRTLTLEMLSGKRSLKTDITSVPPPLHGAHADQQLPNSAK